MNYTFKRNTDKIVTLTVFGSINLTVAKKIVSDRKKFCNYKPVSLIVDIRKIKVADKEARDYLAKEGMEQLFAGALIVNSYSSMMLGNLFLWFNKPEVSVRLFTNEKKAIEWLEPIGDSLTRKMNDEDMVHNKNILNDIDE